MIVCLQLLLVPLDTVIGSLQQTSCPQAQSSRVGVKGTVVFVKEGVKII